MIADEDLVLRGFSCCLMQSPGDTNSTRSPTISTAQRPVQFIWPLLHWTLETMMSSNMFTPTSFFGAHRSTQSPPSLPARMESSIVGRIGCFEKPSIYVPSDIDLDGVDNLAKGNAQGMPLPKARVPMRVSCTYLESSRSGRSSEPSRCIAATPFVPWLDDLLGSGRSSSKSLAPRTRLQPKPGLNQQEICRLPSSHTHNPYHP